MKKPFIFGHRGAMGYCIENTITSFEKAIEMNAGIETDVRLTMDNHLVCFHDPGFEIDNEWYMIKKLTYQDLQNIEFNDKRSIPLFKDVYKYLIDGCNDLRFSCDIGDKRAGIELIRLAKKYKILEKIEITEISLRILKHLRSFEPEAPLVHTIPHNLTIINSNTVDFERLHDLKIKTINVKYDRAKVNHFQEIIDNNFNCYVWGVNSKHYMRKIFNLKYKDETVEAIYSNYPDVALNIREEIYK